MRYSRPVNCHRAIGTEAAMISPYAFIRPCQFCRTRALAAPRPSKSLRHTLIDEPVAVALACSLFKHSSPAVACLDHRNLLIAGSTITSLVLPGAAHDTALITTTVVTEREDEDHTGVREWRVARSPVAADVHRVRAHRARHLAPTQPTVGAADTTDAHSGTTDHPGRRPLPRKFFCTTTHSRRKI